LSDTGEKWEYNGKLPVMCRLREGMRLIQERNVHILIEFGITMNEVRRNKMCLKETWSKFRIGKHLSLCSSYSEMSKTTINFDIAFKLCFTICRQE